jgi:hypothetical protein
MPSCRCTVYNRGAFGACMLHAGQTFVGHWRAGGILGTSDTVAVFGPPGRICGACPNFFFDSASTTCRKKSVILNFIKKFVNILTFLNIISFRASSEDKLVPAGLETLASTMRKITRFA